MSYERQRHPYMTLKGEEAETVYIHLVRDLHQNFNVSFSVIQLPHEMKHKDEVEAESETQPKPKPKPKLPGGIFTVARPDLKSADDAQQAAEEAEGDAREPTVPAKDELDYDENEDAKEDIPQVFEEVSTEVVAPTGAASASSPQTLSPKDCHKIIHGFPDYANY